MTESLWAIIGRYFPSDEIWGYESKKTSTSTTGQKVEFLSDGGTVVDEQQLTRSGDIFIGAVTDFTVDESIMMTSIKSIDKDGNKTWNEPSESSGWFYFCDKDDILLYRTQLRGGQSVDFTRLSNVEYYKIARVYFQSYLNNAKPIAELCTRSGHYYLNEFKVSWNVFKWQTDSKGMLYNSESPEIEEKHYIKPYPAWLWRTDSSVDDGMLYHELLPWVKKQTYNPVYQPEYITVFDMETKQDGFENNGLAVLNPISCKITEILNGQWTLDIEHAIDPDGKWEYILEKNIIKALGQLFIIISVDDSGISRKGTIKATAEHIFYWLNDLWIFPGADIRGEIINGYSLSSSIINSALNHSLDSESYYPSQIHYDFAYGGTLKIPQAVALSKWYKLRDGCTPIDIIMGSNGIISSCGGELYRDNFYFSVDEKMENAQGNSFDIHIGHNLKGIDRTVDFSQFCAYFRGYMNEGDWFAIAWNPSSLTRAFPHSPVRSKNFSYTIDEETLPANWTDDDKWNRQWELLKADVKAYFGSHCAPVISYRVSVEDVKNNPDYKEFSNNPRYNVGDTGRVYDERNGGYVSLKISKTVKDAVTGKTLEVTFGDLQSFTRPSGYSQTTIVGMTPTDKGGEIQVRDKSANYVFDLSGDRVMQKEG